MTISTTGGLDTRGIAENAEAIDVSTVLDGARFGAAQYTVLAFTFVALVMDGFDIQAIAFAAPALTELWQIERSTLGPVLAAALLGMVIGAGGLGPLGDRHGRKTALLASCALMGIGSFASAFAAGPMELAAYRFLTGIGLGGAMPNATALMFEFAPRRWRQVATSVALIGVPLGGMVGAALARWLIPAFGWQALFVVGGIVPVLLACAMWPLLPESPRYLATQHARAPELLQLMNRIAGGNRYTASVRFTRTVAGEGTTASAKSTVTTLFSVEYRGDTLILWVIFFTNVFSVYFFFNWLPTVLASAQLDYGLAVSGSLFFNLGGVLGALAGSVLIGRFGSRVVLATFGALAVVSALSIGANDVFDGQRDTSGINVLMWSMAAAGCCINALQIGMFSVAANVYPTFCRSTGVGWSLAIARFGGIVSSFAGATFFALGLAPRDFFFAIGGVLTITCLGVVVLRRHILATRQGSSQ
jgi:MFS transporter, AAHS family, 4-hydroxybenzoate transporter